MKKIIWIDVGTHFAQEHTSIFGSNFNFYRKALKRILIKSIFNRGKAVDIRGFKEIVKYRAKIRKQRRQFYSIFVEANPKIAYRNRNYVNADMVFNIALTDDTSKEFSIIKLYLGDGNELSQGSSVFLEKGNVTEDSYLTTSGVSAHKFFSELRSFLTDKFGDYEVLLRLNCEGVEDDVIYAAYHSFGKQLKLICGSLKDVEGVKGKDASTRLDNFITENQLLFVFFYSGIDSWPQAHKAVCKLLSKLDKS